MNSMTGICLRATQFGVAEDLPREASYPQPIMRREAPGPYRTVSLDMFMTEVMGKLSGRQFLRG